MMRTPTSATSSRAATACNARSADLLGIHPNDPTDARPWLRHGAWPADHFPLRKDFDGSAAHPAAARRLSVRHAWKATACTRFQSDRCTPAPSSPATSAFPSSASACCAWKRAWATRTRAIEKRFETMTLEKGPTRRPHQRRFDGRLRLGLCDGGRKRGAHGAARTRAVAARAAAGARAHRQSSGRPRLPRQRCRSGLRPRAVLALKEDLLRTNARAVRPPLPDGQHRSRRRGARPG